MGNESIQRRTFVEAIRQVGPWGRWDDLRIFQIWGDLCTSVLDLASIRHDGPYIPFGVQFFRVIRARSSDPRDKVFGILGLSIFEDEECAITPDYNKDVIEVSIQASVAILKDYFASYIKYQPWLHTYKCSSWVLHMEGLSLPTSTKYTTVHDEELSDAIQRGGGIAPMISFLDDPSILITVGLPTGRIVAFDEIKWTSSSSFDTSSFLQNIRRELHSTGNNLSAKKLLSVLLGPYSAVDLDPDLLVADLETLLSVDTPWIPEHLLNLFERYYRYGDGVFLTDAGHIGVCHCGYRSFYYEDTFVAAALFGIQLPFILERVNNGYKLWALAYIDGHTLGDKHVEAMGPDDDWRDLVRNGKMEEYRIV